VAQSFARYCAVAPDRSLMSAAVLYKGAAAPVVEQVPVPAAGTGQLAVEVCAAALNPVDIRVASGTHPTIRPTRPYTPGFEGVGRVVGDDGRPTDRRVWWLGGFGTFAERSVIPAEQAVEVPEGLADDAAAAIGIAGMAAWLALVYRGRIKPGDRVLVLGASGSVGRLAIQLARLEGAATVVAAARSADDELLELGADAVVPLRAGDDLTASFLRAEPAGYDVVVDPIFGAPGEAAIEAAAIGARIVVLGARAAPLRVTVSPAVFEKGLSILGHRNSATSVEARGDAYRAVAERMAAGRLRIDRDVIPLRDIAGAWQRQVDVPRRKLVIVP
jgi:NADPH:quinone reductase